ncbi:hypothetical protein G3N58_07885 [Paraburkholderia sp. Ac-20342]|nr:hypothetical protein [Paraburkholderia sp. Ac-20342]
MDTVRAGDISVDVTSRLNALKVSEPPRRAPGVMVPDVKTLIERLKVEAKVL